MTVMVLPNPLLDMSLRDAGGGGGGGGGSLFLEKGTKPELEGSGSP